MSNYGDAEEMGAVVEADPPEPEHCALCADSDCCYFVVTIAIVLLALVIFLLYLLLILPA